MKTPVARGPAQEAPPETVALFISDLHLQPSSPATTALFLSFLEQHALRARQLYLLGDLFEYWLGDDDIETPYLRQIVDALHATSSAGVKIFWMAGNRDFLIGETFARAAGLVRLPDPYVAEIGKTQIVLAHGDAQCTDDIDYQAFRREVRSPERQHAFLAQPLAQRKAIVENLRSGSREAQLSKSMEIMDVNPGAIAALFEQTGTSLMIHGHTHRPAVHLHDGRVRYVLPDWDGDVSPPRGGWLSLDASGTIRRYDAFGVLLPGQPIV